MALPVGSPSPFSQSAFFFTDTNLTLTGPQNILGRSLAVHVANGGEPIIACAPIVLAETLAATEYSNNLVQFLQETPYENSTVLISESYPDTDPPAGVAIYEAVLMTNGLCPADDTPYNPFGVTAPGGGL